MASMTGLSPEVVARVHRERIKVAEDALAFFADFTCACGATAWTLHRHDGNNGLRLQCGACLTIPFPSRFLPQQAKRRQNGQPTLAELLETSGTFCYGCGLSQAALLRARVHLQVHHARAYVDARHDGPFIPLCGVCHEAVSFAQRTLRRFIQATEADV